MVACQSPCSRKVALKRGPWTPEEDMRLISYVKAHGEGRWRSLPKKAGLLRSGKSCRLRWMNYLRPDIKRGHILPDEEDLILRLHRLLGNRWSLIAGRIPGRTDNDIKNYWNCHLSKKLISQGIDPRTHRPLSESEDIWWLRQDCNMDQPILQYTTTHESADLEKYEKDLNIKIADHKEEQISSSAAQAGISHPQSEPTILAFASQEDFCTKLIESDCSETLKQATPMATTYGNTCSYVNPLDLELFINEEFELREGANAGFNSVSQLSCPNQCELPSPSYHFWSTLHSPTTHYHPSC